jgi:hypothetical protein
MARTADEIDVELKRAVARRWVAKDKISALSRDVIADTRFIDLLLAERSKVVLHQGAPSAR